MPKKMNHAENNTVDLSSGEIHYLGVKLRHTRMTKGLRLRDLADNPECSESMLSKIENDRAVPSLKTLYRNRRSTGPDGRAVVCAADGAEWPGIVGERPIVHVDPLRNDPGLTIERLIPYHQSHLLQGTIHNIAPGGSCGGLVSHEGEEVAYIKARKLPIFLRDKSSSSSATSTSCSRPAIQSVIDRSSRTDTGTAAMATPS
jgi:transcriptional regulator with XRE-family HTH domain